MIPQLQKQFESHSPYDMLNELRRMFEKQAAVEPYDLTNALYNCKQEDSKSVGAHDLEMKSYMDPLEQINYHYKEFGSFVRNFDMHCTGKTVSE